MKICFFFILLITFCLSKNVTISNVQPRVDKNGNLMDIHDGSLI